MMSQAGLTRDFLGDVSGPHEAALRALNSTYIGWDNSMSTDLETKVMSSMRGLGRKSEAPAV